MEDVFENAKNSIEKIEASYISQTPRWRDLLRNLEARDVVLLDGDSALAYALDSPALERRYQGQLLHVIYCFESLLDAFLSRKVALELVFFREHAKLWATHPIAALARKLIVSHIAQRSGVILHSGFAHAASDEWLQLAATRSYVFAGTYVPHIDLDEQVAPAAVATWRAVQLSFSSWVRCAALQEIVFSDNNAFGFIAQPTWLPLPSIGEWLEDVLAQLPTRDAVSVEFAAAEFAALQKAAAAEMGDAQELSATRRALVAVAAAAVLKAGLGDASVVRAWCRAVHAVDALPLAARAALQPAESDAYPSEVRDTLGQIAAAVGAAVDALRGEHERVCTAAADSFDGRWTHVALSQMAYDSAAASGACVWAWQEACRLAGTKAAAVKTLAGVPPLNASGAVSDVPDPLRAHLLRVEPSDSADDDAAERAAIGTSLEQTAPAFLPLVEQYGKVLVGEDAVKGIELMPSAAAARLTAPVRSASTRFARDVAWQPCAHIMPEASNTMLKAKELRDLARMKVKQRARHKQKFLAFQQTYAQSLEGTTALAGKRVGSIMSVSQADDSAKDNDRNDDGSHKGGWAGQKSTKPTKADLIRAANAKKREIEAQERELSTWHNFKRTLSANDNQAYKEMKAFAKSRETDGVRVLIYHHMIERLLEQRRHRAASQAKQLRITIALIDCVKRVAQMTRRAVLLQWATDEAERAAALAAAAKGNKKAKLKKGQQAPKKAAPSATDESFQLPETCAAVPVDELVTAVAVAATALRQLGFDCKWLLEDEASEDELAVAKLRRYDASAAPNAAGGSGKNKKQKAKAAKAAAKAAGGGGEHMAPPHTSLKYLMPQAMRELVGLAKKTKKGELGCNATKNGDLLRFQLTYMGHLMDRGGKPNAPDSRVAFTPDRWQRSLLDLIDSRSSAVVVAPTSSGKTFVSHFCMKAVASDIHHPNGTVVFVAPTKALVNQVAAQVYYTFGDRFGVLTSDYRHNVEQCRFLVTVAESLAVLLRSAESVSWTKRIRYAIFDEAHFIGAGDEGADWEACFTMVQCPFLALSATIGNQEELRGWLQSVQDSKKARVDAAGEEADYLFDVESVPRVSDGPIHRHADLQKFVYLPATSKALEAYGSADEAQAAVDAHNERMKAGDVMGAAAGAFVGFDRPRDIDALDVERDRRRNELVPLHPLAAANVVTAGKEISADGVLPRGLTLSPPEVIELYEAMLKCVKQQVTRDEPLTSADSPTVVATRKRLKALSTASVLGRGFLTRRQVRDYESELQTLLRNWLDGVLEAGVALDDARDKQFLQACATDVLELMRSDVDRRFAQLNDSHLDAIREAARHGAEVADANKPLDAPHSASFAFLETHVLALLIALERADKLPCIIFHESSYGCERLCEAVVVALERLEVARVGEVDEKAEAKASKRAEKARKRAEDAASKKRVVGNKGEDPDDRDDANEELTGLDDQVLDASKQHISPAFSFVRATQATLTPNGVEEMIEYAVGRSKLLTPDSALVRGLRRGIGVHHTMAEKKYRQAVELLFRSHYIQVVFATSSLAYGIHMPCRSVAFAGDSLSLSALDYNQMAGRAGRRGYDLIGNVVFFGLPMERVCSLVAADVPSLSGVAPAVSVMALRGALLASAEYEDRAEQDGVRRLASLMSTSARTPFFAIASQELVRQLHERLFFAIDALARYDGAMTADGVALPLSGFTVFMSELGLSANALVRLLRSGGVHSMCVTSHKRSLDAVHHDLLVLMSHLLCPKKMSSMQRLVAHRCRDENSAVARMFADHKVPVGTITLPPLPRRLRRVLVRLEDDLLREASAWARFTAKRLGEPTADASSLPVTQVRCGGSAAPDAAVKQLCDAALKAAASNTVQVRSPFAALSNASDTFVSASELRAAARTDLAVNASGFVPQLLPTDVRGRMIPLNAYVVDFYRHGSADSLVRSNGLPGGEAWHHLIAFQRAMEVLEVGLHFHCKETAPRDPFYVVVHSLLEQFSVRADRIWA